MKWRVPTSFEDADYTEDEELNNNKCFILSAMSNIVLISVQSVPDIGVRAASLPSIQSQPAQGETRKASTENIRGNSCHCPSNDAVMLCCTDRPSLLLFLNKERLRSALSSFVFTATVQYSNIIANAFRFVIFIIPCFFFFFSEQRL